MPGTDNLKPPSTTDEAREWGRTGGKKSGESRRKKRDAKEAARLFLNLAATEQLDDNLAKLNVKKIDRTNMLGVIARLTLSAQNGNVRAAEVLFEIAGYNDAHTNNSNNMSVNIDQKDDENKVIIYLPHIEE